VGRPRMVPRWALGYVGGGMRYSMSDDPPADGAVLGFVDRCAREGMPCSAFQLSSGYTVAERPPRTRNVFTWNRARFRDPGAWVGAMRRRGVRVVANLKPYVLRCHPAYAELEAAGALFTDPRTGGAAVTRLWSAGGGESEDGSHLDFTSRAAWEWWTEGVKRLRAMGVEGIWNDNNEYTIPDDDWECAADLPLLRDGLRRAAPASSDDGRQDRSVGVWTRAIHTELMARCSLEAARSVAPEERTYVLTRSATPGAMRFACGTWSGDNTSSWDDMAGSVAMTQAAGLSLLPVRDSLFFVGGEAGKAVNVRLRCAKCVKQPFHITSIIALTSALTRRLLNIISVPVIVCVFRRLYCQHAACVVNQDTLVCWIRLCSYAYS
jgi:alpha-glucosidase (family GH31 glycosyl hydrolase)